MKTTNFEILDVRPLLARGDEPFTAIRERVDRLAPGRGLTIIAPFLPSPLIEMLKGEGFHSTMERHVAGAWTVNFWRE